MSNPEVCKTCGTCPTCDKKTPPVYRGYPYQYPYAYPYWYYPAITSSGATSPTRSGDTYTVHQANC